MGNKSRSTDEEITTSSDGTNNGGKNTEIGCSEKREKKQQTNLKNTSRGNKYILEKKTK